ncbi:GNAT family N-acetyltransferase [Paenibacillus bovis]|uniref:N-acetyltransferase domain-containing protein n=1 Tax=Paenibacillus bovis TaxID=1616788 RepID=A0A172ZKD5_9BACL|nr:GNAT family N-acetyltransferase [Paenibacillus bovis]ANF97717.1 hypothetical protein AR543_18010 [Paenibacillus bovis]
MSANHITADAAYIRRYPSFVYSVMDGTIAGAIYTESADGQTDQYSSLSGEKYDAAQIPAAFNNMDRPIWVETTIGLCYAGGGDSSGSFYDRVNTYCLNRIQTKDRFTLFSDREVWNKMAARLPVSLRQLTRQAMEYADLFLPDYPLNLPAGYELKKINESVIQKSTVFDEKYYRTYWGSSAYYLLNGLGYAIVHENQVVCECTSIFANTWTAELDIYTAIEHRGQKLAAIAAQSFINQCIKTRRQPIWECNLDNEASRQLAARSGFVPSYTYSVWTR